MFRLDNGQLIIYGGGFSLSLNSITDMTYNEFLGTAGLVIVISRFGWDVYKDQRDKKQKAISCKDCKKPLDESNPQ